MPLQLHDLLAKGYFPKELPPPFTTLDYANALATPGIAVPPSFSVGQPIYSQQCNHNLVRTGGLRRHLGIPNPVHFYRLASHVVTNWTALHTCAHLSPFSLSKPVDSKPDRAISPEHDLNVGTLRRAELRSRARFILKADISRFFPSIYTHSIPWAIMGKVAAKTAHASGTLRGTWQDSIDVHSQRLNNNQTIGIPIGPDTSRLLAEVILGLIDHELVAKFKRLKGLRFIDDYEIATATRSEAEEISSHLQHLLSQYELAFNPTKTRIVELPVELEHLWTSRIRVFVFRVAGVTGQKNDLTAYFDMVFDLFRHFPEEGLLKYAIARLNGVDINQTNWPLLEHIYNQCLLADPACIPQICDQVTHYMNEQYPMNRSLWLDTLNRIVYEQLPLGHASEAAWAMWLMKIINIKLHAKSAKVVGACEDSIAGLMGLGLAAIGLADAAHLSGLHRYSAPAGLFEDQWLLCYQGNLMRWLGPAGRRSNLSTKPGFSHLETHNVSFFDINVTSPQPVRTASGGPYIGGGGGGGGYI